MIPQPSQAGDVLDSVHEIGGRFVAVMMRNVQHGVRVFDRTGRVVCDLPIPPMTNVMRVAAGDRPNELIVESSGFFSPPSRTRYDMSTGSPLDGAPAVWSDAITKYEVQKVWYRSKDDVPVPMFIVHRRGLVRDGSHPVRSAWSWPCPRSAAEASLDAPGMRPRRWNGNKRRLMISSRQRST